MTTYLDIIDTAVKIGLGALIAGATTYIVSSRKQKHDRDSELIKERKSLVKEIAIKVGAIENHQNKIVVAIDYANRESAIEHIVPAAADAYLIQTLANLVGDEPLLSSTSKFAEIFESLYDELNKEELDWEALDRLSQELGEARLATFPHIRSAFVEIED